MSINPLPTSAQIVDKTGLLVPIYQAFLASLYNWLSPVGQSGTTAQRPVPGPNTFMYIGRSYFDTTLGLPIWVKSLNPTVWVNGAGTPV